MRAGVGTVPDLPPKHSPTATLRQRQEATPVLDDYRELRRRLGDAGLLDPQPRAYLLNLAAALVLLAGGGALLALFRTSWAVVLTALALAVATVQLDFLVHDAGHHQAFRRRWQNALAGILLGDLLLGTSYGWWVRKHNAHHAHPNHTALDADIDLPLIAFSAEQAAAKRGLARFVARHQAFLAVPLLTLVSYGQRYSSLHFLATARSAHRRWELAAMLAHHALFVGMPVAALGPWPALLLIATHQAAAGLYLGLVFAPNHKGMALIEPDARLGFVREQVLTARNVRPHPLVDWWYGGLNYQIEHHLFPALPRNRLRAARPIIRAFCRERGLPYHETSVAGSYREILAYLHAVGAPLRRRRQAA